MPADRPDEGREVLIERLREAGVAASDGHAFGRPDTEDVLWWIDKHADKVLRELLAARLEEMTASELSLLHDEMHNWRIGFTQGDESLEWSSEKALLSLLAPEVPR